MFRQRFYNTQVNLSHLMYCELWFQFKQGTRKGHQQGQGKSVTENAMLFVANIILI